MPTPYPLIIKVNNVDVTAYVDYSSITFDDYRHAVSSFDFTMEAPVGVVPTKNHQVVVIAKTLPNTPVIFLGYIVELETRKRKNGITLVYEAQCADMKIRLQKSVLDVDSLTGSDTDILGALLSNAYPDLSSEFDFSTNATSLLGDLELPTANNNILDSISQLSDLVGGSDWYLDEPTETAVNPDYNVTFDVGGYISYNIRKLGLFGQPASSGGNPNNCARDNGTDDGTNSTSYLTLRIDFSPTIDLYAINFDYYCSYSGDPAPTIFRATLFNDEGISDIGDTLTLENDGAWHTVSIDVSDAPPTGVSFIALQIGWATTGDQTTSASYDYRFDNVQVWESIPDAEYTTPIVWDDEAPDAAFDIDIDLSDEFAFDIDLSVGDFDDFNSVTVIGGFTNEAISWVYESDGDQNHFDLELPVKDITVLKNTGTDMSPVFSLQSLGIWGTDELTGDGGDKDVLYDKENHWLLFNSNPSNLSKSFLVQGTIEKPLRVRVENIEDGDPVFATTVYNSNITSLDEAIAVGNAALAKKNAIRRLEFNTYEPTLKVGEAITVSDSNRGLDERIVINRISTKWLGASGHAEFHVFCGEDDDYGADTIIANNDKRSRENSALAETGTTSVSIITDESGNAITDESGYVIYED